MRPAAPKDDPTDAEVILELLVRHRDKLKPLAPESGDMRALRRLVEWRRDLVQDRTRLTNRITDGLKAYFPQVLEWFSDKEAAIFADFLERWPMLQHAQRARRETLEASFEPATSGERQASRSVSRPSAKSGRCTTTRPSPVRHACWSKRCCRSCAYCPPALRASKRR